MARVKYVPPAGVSDMAGYIEYVQGLMAKAHTDPAAFQEANDRMGKEAMAAFGRWLSGRPQEWDETRTLNQIHATFSTRTDSKGENVLEKVTSGDKKSARVGVFLSPVEGVVYEVIAKTFEADSDDGDDEGE